MKKDLNGLKKQELVKLAQEHEIKNASHYKKSELISLLEARLSQRQPKKKPSREPITSHPISSETKKTVPSMPQYLHPGFEGVFQPQQVSCPVPKSEPELPVSYGVTKIVLIARDPYWCYSYWDFSGDTYRQIENWFRELPKPRPVLRVYDVTDIIFNGGNAHSFFDVAVHLDSKNWYLEVGKPDRNYLVDLGLVDQAGRFYLIARSNVVRTPRDAPSDVIDEEWMSADFELLYELSGGLKIRASSAELVEKVKKGVLFRQWISSGAFSSR